MANPFTPGFGTVPTVMAGRDDLLGDIQFALASGPRHPGFVSLLIGERGVGKTAVLMATRDRAEQVGWRVCQVDALLPEADTSAQEALTEQALDIRDEIAPPDRRNFSEVRAGPAGVRTVPAAVEPRRTRRMQRAFDELADLVAGEGGAGVLMIVDEFHNLTPPEANVIASTVQQVTKGSEKPLALLGAGLTYMTHTLLTHKGFTFFQRCKRHRIGNLSLSDAKYAMAAPLEDAGIFVDDILLSRAAQATNGFPFAVQSIGYHLWEAAQTSDEVTERDLTSAIDAMRTDVDQAAGVDWDRFSPRLQDFLAAMSQDAGTSRIADVAARIGAKPNQANALRKRLIDAGAVASAGYGRIVFSDQRLRDLAAAYQAEIVVRARVVP